MTTTILRIILFYLSGELEPVLSGDVDVHEDEVGGMGFDLGQDFVSLFGLVDLRPGQPPCKNLFE